MAAINSVTPSDAVNFFKHCNVPLAEVKPDRREEKEIAIVLLFLILNVLVPFTCIISIIDDL